MPEQRSSDAQDLLAPSRVRYIKLGRAGGWEAACLEQGIIRIGFGSAAAERFRFCRAGRWRDVADYCVRRINGQQVPEVEQALETTRAMGDAILGLMRLLTFHDFETLVDLIFSTSGWRRVGRVGGTQKTLDIDLILPSTNERAFVQVETTRAMGDAILGLMRLLTFHDFETLVDLIFSTSGWRRVGRVGGTQKTLDIDLILPSTNERAFVQVKSRTTSAQLADYVGRFGELDAYDRMFYVYHTGEAATDDDRVTVIGPDQLAPLVMDAGLVSWLIRKVS